MTPPTDDPAAGRLWESLVALDRVRVPYQDLLRCWGEAEPGLVGSVEQRDRLADALAFLEAGGLLQRSRKQVRGLPSMVTLLTGARDRAPRRSHGYRPELRWVPALHPRGRTERRLQRLNDWFRDRPEDLPVVPPGERSLEIFAAEDEPEAEKVLEHHLWRVLFQPGRLTPEDLRVERVSPPFVRERVGSGGAILVAENWATYRSLVRAAREQERPPVGVVGFGQGNHFEEAVNSAEGSVRRIHYFGDLDRRGLAIPASAQRRARRVPPLEVVPAAPLYRALLARGRPAALPARARALGVEEAADLVAWLPPDLRRPVTDLLVTRRRLAQEWVGYALLRDLGQWIGP